VRGISKNLRKTDRSVGYRLDIKSEGGEGKRLGGKGVGG